jgi:hypothetical protein
MSSQALSSIAPLRPLRLGQIIDQAITIYRANFLPFIGIVALVQIPVSLVQFLVASVTSFGQLSGDAGLMMGLAGVGMLGNLAVVAASMLLLYGLANGVIAQATTAVRLGGEKPGVFSSYRLSRPHWVNVLLAVVLAGILSIGLFIWMLIPCIGWLTGPGMSLFFGMTILPLAAPIAVLEGKNAMAAIRRAWDLTRRRFWWVVGFTLVLWAFSQIIVTGPAVLISMASLAAFESSEVLSNPLLMNGVQSFAAAITSVLYMPVYFCAMTLMYLDLRVRTEGLDLAMQMAPEPAPEGDAAMLLPGEEPAPSEPAGSTQASQTLARLAPAEEQTRLVTNVELGYFAGIALIAIGLYVALVVLFIAMIGAVAAASGL